MNVPGGGNDILEGVRGGPQENQMLQVRQEGPTADEAKIHIHGEMKAGRYVREPRKSLLPRKMFLREQGE